MKNQKISTRVMAGSAMLSAVAVVLQYLEFPIPFLMPPFIKFDLSDLPALIGAFAYGPLSGVIIELIKNLIHCLATKSATVGELSNFMLGAVFTLTAGLIYKHNKTKKTAIIGGLTGAVVMGLFSIPSNYFVVYPFYYNFMPEDVVLAAYQAILPGVSSILASLFIFNLPFTIVKGLVCVLIAMPIYKPLTRVLKDRT
ncbi:MAG: ECF transporter S component [Lachnospiraceae bacterium]|nr:ECF transporter S component [Lachnospiraceae bacterium]